MRLLLTVLLVGVLVSTVAAAPKIADQVAVAGKWDGSNNLWSAQVMGVRDVGAQQYVFGAMENVQAANGINLATGVWILDRDMFSVGVDGGLATLWKDAAPSDSLHNLINYVQGKVGALVVFRPFDVAGGLYAKYDYYNPVRENALDPVHSVSAGVVFDL
jgi:hypothetical protein